MEKLWKNSVCHKVFAGFVFFLSSLSIFAQFPAEISESIQKVKEASYQDSVRLFKQRDDALNLIRKSSSPQAEAEILLYCGNYYFYVRKMEEAKKYYENALAYAEEKNYRHISQLAKIRLAFWEYDQRDRELGRTELEFLLKEAKRDKDNENIADALNLLGIINEDKGEMKEVLKLYLEGKDLSETNHMDYYAGVFRNNLGLLKLYTGQPNEAMVDFKAGLSLADKIHDQRLTSHIQLNMAVTLVSMNKFAEGEPMYKAALLYSRKNNLPNELAVSYLNLGTAFFRVGKEQDAMAFYDSAIVILQKFKFERELSRAYGAKAELLFKRGEKKEAEWCMEKMKELAIKTGNLETLSFYYYFYYSAKRDEGDFKSAMENYLSYTQVKDSMNSVLNFKIISDLDKKYKTQKKENELVLEKAKTLELEKKNRDEKLFKWIAVFGGFGLLIILSVFFYIRHNRRIRKDQEAFSRQLIEKIEEERKRIAMDLHDDVGQSLSVIKSKISKNTSEISEIETDLGSVIEQTRQISRNLFPSYLEKIGLKRAVASLSESVQKASGIQCSFEIADEVEKLPLDFKTHLYRIIQECTNNTVKHSGATALKSEIIYENAEFRFEYRDNGKGIRADFAERGLGILSIKERVKMMEGTFSMDKKITEKGIRIYIKFRRKID